MDKLLDLNKCEEGYKRFGGSDKKDTIFIDGKRYMVKYNNVIKKSEVNKFTSGSRNNVFSEYISCHIISTLGIPVQNTLLGIRNGHIVVACEDFCVDGYELNEFEKYGNSIDIDFEEARYPEISDIISVIRRNKQMDPKEIEIRFWDTFCIDALLGNFDRHTGNWGYLFNDDKHAFTIAPIYDCGACLYPMLNDEGIKEVLNDDDLIAERIFKFPKSAFQDNGVKVDYYSFLTDYSNFKRFPLLKDSLCKIVKCFNIKEIENIIYQTPELSDDRRLFYNVMIKKRFDKILIPSLKLLQEHEEEQNKACIHNNKINRKRGR